MKAILVRTALADDLVPAPRAPGEVMRATLDNPGAFPCFCEPQRAAGMTGRITVQP